MRRLPFPTLLPSLALALAVLLAACGGGSDSVVTFGAAGPWNEAYGAMNRRGIELALAELNARPDRRGRKIEVLFRNDSGDGVKATAVAKEFLATPTVVAVIGHVNSGAMVSAARVYDQGLPAVATTASSPSLTGISRWAFRVISSDSVNGQEIAHFVNRLGRRKVAVLYENNAYGRGLSDSFRRNYSGEIVSIDPIGEGGDQNLEPFVTYFKRQSPELVFVAGTGTSGEAFLEEARSQHLTADLMGGDGWSVLSSDSLAEGVYVGAPFSADDPSPEARKFVDAFRQQYHMDPDGNAALAYDATMLLARAADAAGADRKAIRDYLADQSHTYQGVTGAIRFGANGDPVGKSIVMTRIHHGALTVETGAR